MRSSGMDGRGKVGTSGVRELTYCVKQRKKTKNVSGRFTQIMVRGSERWMLRSQCAECGSQKATFLTKAKTGGAVKRVIVPA